MEVNEELPNSWDASPRHPLKVAYVGHTAKLGGAEIGLMRTIECIDHSQILPFVVLAECGPFVEKLRGENIDVFVLPLAGKVVDTRKDTLDAKGIAKPAAVFTTVRYAVRLARLLKDRNIDVVHTNTLKANLYGLLAARLARKPIVWHVRDNIDESYLPASAVKLVRFFAKMGPDYVVTCSDAVRSKLTADPYVALHSRIATVYDGLSTFPEVRVPNAAIDEMPLIGIIGRLAPWKGQDVFVKAASIIKGMGVKAKYLVIGGALFGENQFESKLHSLALRLGLQDDLSFTGYVENVDSILRSLSVLVHASISPEPLGQVVIEGLAHGVPVVATAAGGPVEILSNGEFGLLTTPGSADSLAEAVMAILADRDLASRLSANGPLRVRDAFSAEQSARQLASIYSFVMQKTLHQRRATLRNSLR